MTQFMSFQKVPTRFFFDREIVEDQIDKPTRIAFARWGGLTMRVARRSMRRGGKTPRTQISKPGKPPKTHTQDLKRKIFFAYSPEDRGTVVGPLAFKGSDVPKVLEFGGRGIEARPYMGPAFNVTINKLPSLYP